MSTKCWIKRHLTFSRIAGCMQNTWKIVILLWCTSFTRATFHPINTLGGAYVYSSAAPGKQPSSAQRNQSSLYKEMTRQTNVYFGIDSTAFRNFWNFPDCTNCQIVTLRLRTLVWTCFLTNKPGVQCNINGMGFLTARHSHRSLS